MTASGKESLEHGSSLIRQVQSYEAAKLMARFSWVQYISWHRVCRTMQYRLQREPLVLDFLYLGCSYQKTQSPVLDANRPIQSARHCSIAHASPPKLPPPSRMCSELINGDLPARSSRSSSLENSSMLRNNI